MAANLSLSVIIPAFQAEKTISRAVHSVLAIGLDSLEVIVVNDGSIDSTSEIVKDIARYDSRVNLIEQINSGRSVARNAGFLASSGDWVMFVDSDDYLLPNASPAICRELDSAEDIVIFPYVNESSLKVLNPHYDESHATLNGVFSFMEMREACLKFDYSHVANSNLYQFNSVWARLYRRDLLLNFSSCSPWDGSLFPTGIKFSEDRLFNIALLSAFPGGTVAFSKNPTYFWDLDKSATTGVFRNSDIGRLVDYSSSIKALVVSDYLSQSEEKCILAAEISNQFKRFVRLNCVFNANSADLWSDALGSIDPLPKVSDFPNSVLGPFSILKPAICLLLHRFIKCAFLYEKFLFNLQEFVQSRL